MISRLLVDLVVLTHVAFVLFVVFGGLFCLRYPKVSLVHLPAVLWGALIEFRGWICPLTPLENRLRQKAGVAAYEGGFLEHYLTPILYPEFLTREIQIALGISVLLLNLVIYAWLLLRRANR